MHKYFMLAALEQARLGRGICSPNPSVGAIAVHAGEIFARAWHRGAGTAHAEQLLLEKIPQGKQGVILYVTLEPCNHWGKTPPCVTAIIQRGISQVVYGFCDPNPEVAANNTPKILHDQGIETIHYPLPEIDQFYQSYSYWMATKRPWITVKLAQTLDGKIAGPGRMRQHLSNEECTEFTHTQRLHADIILTTAATIKQDNPLLNVRLAGRTVAKPLAILDRCLSIEPEAKLFANAAYCHVFHDRAYPCAKSVPNCAYHRTPVKHGRLDLSAVITQLGQLGYHDVWVEAGGILFSALHQQNLVQRTYLYIIPDTLGKHAYSAYQDDTLFAKEPIVTWLNKKNNVIACLDWQKE